MNLEHIYAALRTLERDCLDLGDGQNDLRTLLRDLTAEVKQLRIDLDGVAGRTVGR
jgi:hypothetical protein